MSEALVQPHELVEAVAREAGGSTPDPYAALAVGILRQAVHDACREPSEFGPEARRCEAREFLRSEVAAWLIEWAGGGSGLPPGRIERFLAELPELPPGTGACRWCGVDFDARRVRTRARYCSMECRRAASNGRRRAPEEARPCSECGRGHVPKRRPRGPSYCSTRCRLAARNTRRRFPAEAVDCAECRRSFVPKRRPQFSKSYCGRECREAAKARRLRRGPETEEGRPVRRSP